MTPIHSRLGRLLVIAAVLTVAGAARIAHAQDDVETEEKTEASAEATRGEEVLRRRVERLRQRSQVMYKMQFDGWVVSQFGTPVGARDQLETLLASRLYELEAEWHLTAAQVKKLQLAGRGDIKRFMDRLDDIARAIEDPRSSIDDLRAAMLETHDLRALVGQRLFGETSLLGKILVGSLDKRQEAERKKSLLERSRTLYQIAGERAVEILERNLGLKRVQSDELEELLAKYAHPPRRFGHAAGIALVLFQASRIPEDEIRPIFDLDQWSTLSRWMAAYKKGGAGEQMLKRNGFVFDDEPTVARPDRARPVSRKDGPMAMERNLP